MTDQKRPLKVFLCHAHSDKDAVKALYTRLTNDGVDAWLDKEKLLPGQDWELEIKKAVREADVVVVCLSKQFNQAGFRQKEVRLALDTAMEQPEGEIFIIPARLEECDNLESLRKWHWVDLFEDNGYQMLMRALRARADRIGVILQIKRNKTVTKSGVQRRLNPITFLYITFFLLFIGSLSLLPLLDLSEKNNKSPVTQTAEITVTFSLEAIQPAHTSTPLSTEITDAKGVSMVLVPEGDFIMGSDTGDIVSRPAHRVRLDKYYIDKFEVTNLQYSLCVLDGVCKPPVRASSSTRLEYYGNNDFNNYPVIFLEHSMAKIYCEWRNGRLPTEAEWEKAARGTDERKYPWGNDISSTICDYANHSMCLGDTSSVGLYELGISYYGLYDMAGNVSEYVSDLFDGNYYVKLPDMIFNPTGPGSGFPVIKGGSWRQPLPRFGIRTYDRHGFSPTDFIGYNEVGFRCAKDVIP